MISERIGLHFAASATRAYTCFGEDRKVFDPKTCDFSEPGVACGGAMKGTAS